MFAFTRLFSRTAALTTFAATLGMPGIWRWLRRRNRNGVEQHAPRRGWHQASAAAIQTFNQWKQNLVTAGKSLLPTASTEARSSVCSQFS